MTEGNSEEIDKTMPGADAVPMEIVEESEFIDSPPDDAVRHVDGLQDDLED